MENEPYYHKMPRWPKPSPIPYCGIIFLLVNAMIAYAFDHYAVNVFWLSPFWLLNGFFFWAERDIYMREKRNYDDWYEEMRSIFEDEDRFSWDKSLMAVQRRRKRG